MNRFRRLLGGGLGALLLACLLMLVLLRTLAPSLLHFVPGSILGPRGELQLATAHPTGAYHAFGTQLVAAGQRTNLALRLRTTEGSRENLELLGRGQIDLALVQGGLHIDHERVRGIARLHKQLVHLVTQSNGAIHSVEDLAGRRLAVGGVQSGTASVAEQLIDFYRLPTPPQLVHMPVQDVPAALATGKVDAALSVYSLFAPAVDDLLADGSNRLVPLIHTHALAQFTPGMSTAVIPDGTYGPQRSEPPASLTTVSVPTLLVARANLDGNSVRAVLRSIFDVQFLERAELTEHSARQLRGVQLHPAASDYYTRNAPISSGRFEIASFFIAALLALASLIRFLIIRRNEQRLETRRLRIVPYFESLLVSGERIVQEKDSDILSEIIVDMMRTQHQAERDWLQGQLDTEHMENLYAVFDVRCRNAFDKIRKRQQ